MSPPSQLLHNSLDYFQKRLLLGCYWLYCFGILFASSLPPYLLRWVSVFGLHTYPARSSLCRSLFTATVLSVSIDSQEEVVCILFRVYVVADINRVFFYPVDDSSHKVCFVDVLVDTSMGKSVVSASVSIQAGPVQVKVCKSHWFSCFQFSCLHWSCSFSALSTGHWRFTCLPLNSGSHILMVSSFDTTPANY